MRDMVIQAQMASDIRQQKGIRPRVRAAGT